jgi:TrmH family RNA methyltransferase
MNKEGAVLLSSKSDPRFKDLRAALNVSGSKRAFTVLLGEKLVVEWLDAEPLGPKNRLTPLRWLRMEGHGMHPLEHKLPLEAWELKEKMMKDISDSASPPSIALVMGLAGVPSGALANRVVVPWGIQDPGNLGAIFRSAAAFGFQEALLGPGCADPFSPKALRGSMGAAFLLSVRRFAECHFMDGRWVALDSGPGAAPIESVDLSAPLRLMVGNEGHGWRDADLPGNCTKASITAPGVESLNAAVAVGIACFETTRRFGGTL